MGRWAITQRPFLTVTSSLPSSRKTWFSSQPLDLTTNFPRAKFEDEVAFVGLENDLRLAPFAHSPHEGATEMSCARRRRPHALQLPHELNQIVLFLGSEFEF